jgi:hypothetical protein
MFVSFSLALRARLSGGGAAQSQRQGKRNPVNDAVGRGPDSVDFGENIVLQQFW